MNITFRVCTKEDIAVADPVFVAAYGFTGSRVALLRRYWTLQPDGWWLVLLDGKPVGFGGAVDYGAFSYIGMISVHPSVQHRGIGERLMKQILSWGASRACPTLLLDANEKAVSLYRRLGFIEEQTVLQFIRSEYVTLPPVSPAVDMVQPSDVQDLVTFDRVYFGAERDKIFRTYLADFPGRAFVTRDPKGHITGYIFAQSGIIGPWVASTPEDAERLLIRVLSLHFTYSPSVTIAVLNEYGRHILKRYGFHQEDVNYAMCRGTPVQYRQLTKIYGETSSALG